jgi:hypothetical protein
MSHARRRGYLNKSLQPTENKAKITLGRMADPFVLVNMRIKHTAARQAARLKKFVEAHPAITLAVRQGA